MPKNKKLDDKDSVFFRASKDFFLLNYGMTYTEKEEMVRNAIDFVKFAHVKGDYFEFGVFKGETFSFAYHQAINKCIDWMDFYAFDSFEGLPEIKGKDEGFKSFQEGEYQCTLSQFKANLKENQVNLKKVSIIEGWFDKVLNSQLKNELKTEKASIVYIDCDLYESTVPVLNFITSYLQDGTIIIFDDWLAFKGDPEKGQQKATEEWLKKEKKIQLLPFMRLGWSINSFIVKKN